ncbi:MAG: permease [Oscillospiraceae bacterium]|nr:permease [Oscillospiraceae bacterium]MCD8389666.1 permease [Oscillospiraceae bacterium]
MNILSSMCSSSIFMVFCIMAVGLAFGSIKIKGIEIGSAGVFITALVFGHFGVNAAVDGQALPYLGSLMHDIGLVTTSASTITTNMKMCQNIGLACFVTAVGLIAGPSFFANIKKNIKSYVLIAIVIIGLGALTCVAIILVTPIDSSMGVGLLSGSLTTTPGFSAAQEAATTKGLLTSQEMSDYLYNEVTVGHGIAYPFGVLGVVLFVQIVPKMLHADMAEERKVFAGADAARGREGKLGKLRDLDMYGLFAFSFAVALGVLVGNIYVPLPGGGKFSLTSTGGCLLTGLLFGHFGHIGKVSLKVSSHNLTLFREFGLLMFLIGAGVPGGAGFVNTLLEQGWILFVYGILMALVPMIGGYLFSRYVLKLSLLNNLGSITGGMTSTPGLGALISASGTDDVASVYAATYPVALVLVVLFSQLIVTLL